MENNKSTIQQTLQSWFPNAFNNGENYDEVSDYAALRQFAQYTLKLINQNKPETTDPFKIIYLLYHKGSLHDKNAIENEYFTYLAKDESPGTLKKHLELMPDELKSIYIKTILEN
ncbi:MAG: hypothetical protein P1P88_11470 [Bacteroidales bacterium]|nr:hypothetical protein [Bacteroidales bacterium]